MWLSSWLDALRVPTQPQRSRPRKRPSDRPRPLTRPLLVEGLEERKLLTFAAAVDYPTGVSPQAIVSADFNNDGRLDLATANYDSADISVLLGDGAGGFV